jgi:HK97 family phage prohead protease
VSLAASRWRSGLSEFMDLLAAPSLIDIDEWKAKASTGQAPAGALLRKQYVALVKADGESDSRKVAITISTKALDRHRDTVDPLGIDLANYEKNPVVLWAHSHNMPPIARSVALKVNSKALRSVAEFMPAEMSAFADSVYQMVKGGWLNAASIGFLPADGGYEYDAERMGFDFKKSELLEYSIVPVPANPQALVGAKAAGVPMEPIQDWAEQVLDGVLGAGMWVPKAHALAIYKTLAAPAVPVTATAETPVPPVETKEAVAETAAPATVLIVQKEPTFLIDPNSLKAAMTAAVSDVVREQMNFARGRVS